MTVFDRLRRKIWRAGFAMLAVGAIAACDPIPTGESTCKTEYACEIIELTAKEMRTEIGKNFGGGVVLRNARALGQTLVVDMTLPLSSKAFGEPQGQALLSVFAKSFAGGFCEGAYADDFFAQGNTVHVRGFSKDSNLVADQIIKSCGRG